MDSIQNILTRSSVRYYRDEPIPDEVLEVILKAAMSGPSCTNARDWSFLVTRDHDVMCKMADANGAPAEPLRRAKLAVLILGDLERAFQPAPDYWIIDGAIAGQNMVLAANALGVGSVWLGTYPQMERVERQRNLFQLPDTVIPHSIIAFGYPDESKVKNPPPMPMPKDLPPMPEGGKRPEPRPAWEELPLEESRIHMDRW